MQGQVQIVKLTIQSAEVRLRVTPAEPLPTPLPGPVHLRGFVMGPQCPGRTTIEIPYAIRAVEGEPGEEIQGRVLIPEPSLWSDAAPFEYLARVEIWAGETLLEKDAFKFTL